MSVAKRVSVPNVPGLALAKRDLQDTVGPTQYALGQRLQKENAVGVIRWRPKIRELNADIKQGDAIFTAKAHLTPVGKGVLIYNTCSCELGANCCHVAALLLQAVATGADEGADTPALRHIAPSATAVAAANAAKIAAEVAAATPAKKPSKLSKEELVSLLSEMIREEREISPLPHSQSAAAGAQPTPSLAANSQKTGTAGSALDDTSGAAALDKATLSPMLSDWLQALDTAAYQQETKQLSPRKKGLAYILSFTFRGDALGVEFASGLMRKDGTLSGSSLAGATGNAFDLLRRKPDHLGDDEVLIREIMAHASIGLSGNLQLPEVKGDVLFEKLLDTGRTFIGTTRKNVQLKRSERLSGRLSWLGTGQQTSTLTVGANDKPARLMPFENPWYVMIDSGETGPLDLAVPSRVARLMTSESIDDALAIEGELQGSQSPLSPLSNQHAPAYPIHGGALPAAPGELLRTDVDPVAHLRLCSTNDYTNLQFSRAGLPVTDFAELRFGYLGQRVSDIGGPPITPLPGDELAAPGEATGAGLPMPRRIARQPDQETLLLRRLQALGLHLLQNPRQQAQPIDFQQPMRLECKSSDAWIDFVLDHAKVLRKEGWEIEIDPDFHYAFQEVDQWTADIDDDHTRYIETDPRDEGRKNDWFSLSLGIEVDGRKINLSSILMQLLNRRDFQDFLIAETTPPRFLVQTNDGLKLALEGTRLKRYAQLLAELHTTPKDGKLRLSRFDAARLAALEEAGAKLAGEQSARVRLLAKKLSEFSGLTPIAQPRELVATLRPYQLDGLAWLQFLREYDLAGILADDMGLGKTLQTLAHLVVEQAAGRLTKPALLVCPKSLVHNWQAETERFAPSLSVLTLTGLERKALHGEIAVHDLIITTYALVHRDLDILRKQPFHYVILDEAQYIKNAKTKAADAVRELDTRHRLCLTGTPLENHLGELWSQFHFLMPGFLGSDGDFKKHYRTPIEKRGDPERANLLKLRIKPFMLRRTKDQVAAELPPKTEIIQRVALEGAQRDLYEIVRAATEAKVQDAIASKGFEKSRIEFLAALLKLRQTCCDPRLVKSSTAKGITQSAKLELLMTLLPEMIEEGRRVLLFSQFVEMLDLIETEVRAANIPFVRLTGETHDRRTPVARFQALEVPLFLISLKAGGVGLNLTAADTVIHYDPWWNPQAEAQATDRAHRIGQDKPVFVYKLIAEGTVEERILELQARKKGIADQMLAGGDAAARVSSADFTALFAPISVKG